MTQFYAKHLCLSFFISILFCFFFSLHAHSQSCVGSKIEVSMQNFNQTSATSFEFDIYVKNIGTTSLCISALAGGMVYNAGFIPSGATLTGVSQLDPFFSTLNPFGTGSNLTIQPPTSQIRWNQVPPINGICVNLSGPGAAAVAHKYVHLTFNCTLPFDPCFALSLVWNYGLPVAYSNTIATTYCNGNVSSAALSSLTSGTLSVVNPLPYSINCAGPCPTGISTNVTNTCLNGATGTASVSVLNTTSPNGVYTLNGAAPIAYSSSPINITNLAAGTYTLAVTNTLCSPALLDTFTIGSTIFPLLNTVTQTGCNSYVWNVNGTTYTTSGTYTGISTNTSGCTVNETLNLTIIPLTSSSTSQTATGSYTWPLNGITYTVSGQYYSNNSPCRKDTLNLIINPQAIQNLSTIQSMTISPNPTSNYVMLELFSNANSTIEMQLYDLTGRKVLEKKMGIMKGLNKQTLVLKELSNGIYHLHIIENGSPVLVRKISKIE
jgi:hypothetical protein